VTGPRRPRSDPPADRPDPDSPPDWFRSAAARQNRRDPRDPAPRDQAPRDQAPREAAPRDPGRRPADDPRRPVADARRPAPDARRPPDDPRRPTDDGRRAPRRGSAIPPDSRLHPSFSRPTPRPQEPWRGAPATVFPGTEDATQLIQRIADEALYDQQATRVLPATLSRPAPLRQPRPPASRPAGRRERPGDRPWDRSGEHPRRGPANAATERVPRTADRAAARTESTAGVVRAGALMAVATVFSRVSGLLAKIAIAAIIGSLAVNDSYTLANTLPNIVFELLIGGVLTSVAIPLLTRAQRSDADGGQEYTQRLLSLAIVGLLVATTLAVACAPLLTKIYLSSGSKADPQLTNDFARLLLPQIFFYGLAALFGAVLNTKERFAANAWAPVLNNLIVIAVAVLLHAHSFGTIDPDHIDTTPMLILGLGTTLGIVVQALVMIPSLRRAGFRWQWRFGWDRRFAEAGGLLGWATLYVLVSQIGVSATTRIASAHETGGIFQFQTASMIFQMPYGILGVAVLTAIMPRMSRHAAAGDMVAVKSDMSLANRLSAAALLPVTALFFVFGPAVATLLFNWRSVQLDSTIGLGRVLGMMALGLVPLAVTLVQMRVFYAMKDARTPTLINAIMVLVRVPLMYLAPHVLPGQIITGLALSTAISYGVGAVVGEIWLRAKYGPTGSGATLVTLGKMLVASAAGGAAGWYGARELIAKQPAGPLSALFILIVGTVIAGWVIAVMAVLLRVRELDPLLDRVLARIPIGRGRTGTATPTPARTSQNVPPGLAGSSERGRPGTPPPARSTAGRPGPPPGARPPHDPRTTRQP
jgi:putative peptidoglycan lipid II flippase